MTEQAINLMQVAEIQLSYRNNCKPSKRPKVSSANEAYEILINSWDENKIDFIEQAKMLLLSKCNRVLGICEISTGGLTGTILDPRIVFGAALKANAAGIILAHNHPSGNLQPSEHDRRLTEKLKSYGSILEIMVMDHLVVTSEGYYSFTNDQKYVVGENSYLSHYKI